MRFLFSIIFIFCSFNLSSNDFVCSNPSPETIEFISNFSTRFHLEGLDPNEYADKLLEIRDWACPSTITKCKVDLKKLVNEIPIHQLMAITDPEVRQLLDKWGVIPEYVDRNNELKQQRLQLFVHTTGEYVGTGKKSSRYTRLKELGLDDVDDLHELLSSTDAKFYKKGLKKLDKTVDKVMDFAEKDGLRVTGINRAGFPKKDFFIMPKYPNCCGYEELYKSGKRLPSSHDKVKEVMAHLKKNKKSNRYIKDNLKVIVARKSNGLRDTIYDLDFKQFIKELDSCKSPCLIEPPK